MSTLQVKDSQDTKETRSKGPGNIKNFTNFTSEAHKKIHKKLGNKNSCAAATLNNVMIAKRK